MASGDQGGDPPTRLTESASTEGRARRVDRGGAALALGRTVVRFEGIPEPLALSVAAADRFGALRGVSLAMRRVFAELERASASDAAMLFEGEEGTGKLTAAWSLHAAGTRR